MNTNDPFSPKPYNIWKNLFNEFFWTCSGANKDILRQCPTEYSKYFGIGGTIFFTAAMAMLSGGYAFFTIFRSTTLAILFGVFWGLLIFNLDRFIVNTMYSDGKYTISWGELAAGTPRLIIAIFLGIVISTPLELKIFEDEINVQIEDMKKNRLIEYISLDQKTIEEKQTQKENYLNQIDAIRQRPRSTISNEIIEGANDNINTIERQIISLQQKRNNIDREYHNKQRELNHTTDTIQRINIQRRIRSLKNEMSDLDKSIGGLESQKSTYYITISNTNQDEMQKLQQQINEYEKDINIINEEIEELKLKITNASEKYEKILDKEFNGFQAHMLAFGKIKDENPTTKTISLFIMLMFIIIEIAPTFFKMMIASGPYDELLAEEMHRKKATSIQRVSNLNDQINTQIQIETERNRNKLEAETAANKALLEKIAAVQAELLETAVEEWRKEELEKIHANPSQYIQSNTKNS